MNYLIVLFKNKKRKKILNKFKTFDRAKNYYENTMNKSNSILFNKEFENGSPCKYEIGLLELNSTDFESYFVKDDMGRQLKVEIDDPNYKIIKINNFNVEEFIYNVKTKNRLTFKEFNKLYLKSDGLKLISKLNNRVVVQNDDKLEIFSLKSTDESDRFLILLDKYLYDSNRSDCIVVKSNDKNQKKYLYEILSSKGIDKSFLYRGFTTFKKSK